jgi:YidC/Oxa1 family membrane protein insertase
MKGLVMKRIFKFTLLLVVAFSLLWTLAIPSMADPTDIDVSITAKGNVSEVGNVLIKVQNNGPLIKDVKVMIEGEKTPEIDPFKRIEISNPNPYTPPIGTAYFAKTLDKSMIPAGKSLTATYFFSIPKDLVQKNYNLRWTLTYKTKENIEETKTDVFFILVKSPNPFVLGLRWLLDMLSKFGGYGIAVILFAILIKILLWPLNNITMKSQAQMQQLQPKINEINQKFKDNPQQKNEAIMALYKEEKINPASSCLYLLPQLVVLWLLYSALQGYSPLYQQSFLWLSSLGSPDPLFIFPILAGVSTFFQSLSSGQANDPQTKTFTYIMPIFFFYIMMKFPAALSIFWTVFGLVSWGQQYMYMKNKPKPVTSAVEVKPRSNNKVGKK